MKITAFPGRHKSLEMQKKVKKNTNFKILDDRGSSRTNIARTKIIPSVPDEELAKTENVRKNAWNNQ